VEVEAIPRPERPAAHVALLAALFEPGLQPMAVLPDPMAAVKAGKAKERAKKQRMIIAVSVGALVALGALILPNRLANGSLDDAKSAQKKMDAQIASLKPAVALSDQVKAAHAAQVSATAVEAAFDRVLQKVLATAPPEATVQYGTVSLVNNGTAISVSFSVVITQVPDFNAVALWLDNLTAMGAIDPEAPTISKQASETDTNVQVMTSFSATLPLTGDFLSERATAVATTTPAAATPAATPAAGG
jgi:hypothetical protein